MTALRFQTTVRYQKRPASLQAGQNNYNNTVKEVIIIMDIFYIALFFRRNKLTALGRVAVKPITYTVQIYIYASVDQQSACWVFSCFGNPPNSDVDYRIFNVRA